MTAIDNDNSFGRLLTDPNAICMYNGTTMPPVVDTDMARRIDALTPDRIRQELGDKLSPAEVGAAVKRHQGVQAHIEGLRAQGRVISPGQWDQPWVGKLLTPENSYVGRETQVAQGRAW